MILHEALKLSLSLRKQPHKDDFLVCGKRMSEHAQGSSLLPFETVCLAVLVRACLDVENVRARQACSTFQKSLQHSEGMRRDLGPSKEPFLKQVPGHLHWCHPAGSVLERRYPDEKHGCLSPEDRAAPATALQHQNPRRSRGLLIFLGAVLTKVSFHLSRKNALNKWVIHKMPTYCVSL